MILQQPLIEPSVMTVFAQEEKKTTTTTYSRFISSLGVLDCVPNSTTTKPIKTAFGAVKKDSTIMSLQGQESWNCLVKNGIYCYAGNLTELTFIRLKFCFRDKEERFGLERTLQCIEPPVHTTVLLHKHSQPAAAVQELKKKSLFTSAQRAE